MNDFRIVKSFHRAFSGIVAAFREEQNFKIQSVFGVFVLLFAFFIGIHALDFLVLMAAVFFLLILELVNTSVEKLVDIVHPRVHKYAGMIKDFMAAAVLLGSILVIIIIFWVFLGHFQS